MEAFRTHTGIGVPLRRSNVDTDQIIPAVYLKRVTRTGFEDGLFSAWRNDESFILNTPPFDRGSVLVAGPDFGTGSSREHAVWALWDFGFRVVLAPSFADIFRGNALKNGLLPVAIDDPPDGEVTVDLESQIVSGGGKTATFSIEPFARKLLLSDKDEMTYLLSFLPAIEARDT